MSTAQLQQPPGPFLEIVNTTLDSIKPFVEKINENITDKAAVKHHMGQLLQIL